MFKRPQKDFLVNIIWLMISIIAIIIAGENQAFSQVEIPKKNSATTIQPSPVRIIAAYQTSGIVKTSQWTKRGNRSWVGELYKFNINKLFGTDEYQSYDVTGYYPHIQKEVFVHLYGKPHQRVSMYINVHGIADRPDDLIFIQPPANSPKFVPLKASHFFIQDANPTWIHAGKKQRDYFGYWHPVIHLYFLGSEFEPPRKSLEPQSLTQTKAIPRSPLTSDWNIFVPQQSLIIIDATDDDRRYISFKKSREAVLNYLTRIRWDQDKTVSKYLKIASAFEGHLKRLTTVDDIQSEHPKIMAPSSLKDQLKKAFSSFEAIDGPKNVIYIVSSKRADVITPINLENLALNTNKLKSEDKRFHCIVVGDYGGNSLKNLTDLLKGEFYRCNQQKDIVKKLKAILHNRG
jgi:hypothetical protein